MFESRGDFQFSLPPIECALQGPDPPGGCIPAPRALSVLLSQRGRGQCGARSERFAEDGEGSVSEGF